MASWVQNMALSKGVPHLVEGSTLTPTAAAPTRSRIALPREPLLAYYRNVAQDPRLASSCSSCGPTGIKKHLTRASDAREDAWAVRYSARPYWRVRVLARQMRATAKARNSWNRSGAAREVAVTVVGLLRARAKLAHATHRAQVRARSIMAPAGVYPQPPLYVRYACPLGRPRGGGWRCVRGASARRRQGVTLWRVPPGITR